jgi:hypothetical protein
LDGTTALPHHERRWQLLKAGLIATANGYTQTTNVEGVWLDNPPEVCRQFVVSVSAEAEPRLFAMLYLFREKFSQQAIYVASGGESWLVDHQTARPEREYLQWAREVLEL